MFAIAFDMVVSDLKKNYGEPYNNAYFEIGVILRQYGFYNTQGSVYLTEINDMANLYRAIEALKKTDWQRFRQRHTGIQGRGLERLYTSIQGTVTTYNLQIRPLAAM